MHGGGVAARVMKKSFSFWFLEFVIQNRLVSHPAVNECLFIDYDAMITIILLC